MATDTKQQQQQELVKSRSQAASESTSGAEEDAIWLQLLNKMTGYVVAHLPKIWQLVQVSSIASKNLRTGKTKHVDLHSSIAVVPLPSYRDSAATHTRNLLTDTSDLTVEMQKIAQTVSGAPR